ncbi:MAG: aspartyl/glutamyl-tRNA amidotransferase subunit C [Candidatus Absconditabacterales bacterium]
MAITTTQFDRLLEMTMLSLDDQQYEMYLRQMDQIIGYMDTLKQVDTTSVSTTFAAGVSLDRDYHANTIGLSSVQHPITGNMLQIKFKRG